LILPHIVYTLMFVLIIHGRCNRQPQTDSNIA
jgi:hypothetical protein